MTHEPHGRLVGAEVISIFAVPAQNEALLFIFVRKRSLVSSRQWINEKSVSTLKSREYEIYPAAYLTI